MESQRKKIIIISTSLLLHLGVLILLLILYKSPEHEWLYFDTPETAINTPETIFSEPMQQFPDPQHQAPTITPQEETWAELKPRASTLGGSMEMPADAIGVELEGESSNDESSTQDSNDLSSPSDQSAQEQTLSLVSSESQNYSSDISILKNELKTAQPSSKKKVSAKKRQAQQALASMTRGYLEQLKHEGENLIKTIGGDPNKMPSAEQLKYERYLAKIQWCLQNAHTINRDKCQMHEPIEAAMRVYFTLDRNGKMADLKIIQSSGSSFVDRYIRSLFESASSSFPPLPGYIKEDPYQLLYTVMVCWNVTNPSYMGLMRE